MVDQHLHELEIEEVTILALSQSFDEFIANLVLLEKLGHVNSLEPCRQLRNSILLEKLISQLRFG